MSVFNFSLFFSPFHSSFISVSCLPHLPELVWGTFKAKVSFFSMNSAADVTYIGNLERQREEGDKGRIQDKQKLEDMPSVRQILSRKHRFRKSKSWS